MILKTINKAQFNAFHNDLDKRQVSFHYLCNNRTLLYRMARDGKIDYTQKGFPSCSGKLLDGI